MSRPKPFLRYSVSVRANVLRNKLTKQWCVVDEANPNINHGNGFTMLDDVKRRKLANKKAQALADVTGKVATVQRLSIRGSGRVKFDSFKIQPKKGKTCQ